MTALAGDSLLQLPVRLNGIAIGRPVDLILDPEGRVIGVDVLCKDAIHRFLPLGAAEVLDDEIKLDSSLALLEDRDLAFYREHGRTLAGLRGATVLHHDKPAGPLRDLVVGSGGAIEAVVVGDNGSTRRIPFDADVRFGDRERRAPAA